MTPPRDIRRGLAVLTALVLVLLWGGLTFYLRYDETRTIVNANRQGANLARAFAEHITSILRSFDQTLLAMVRDYQQNPASFDAKTAIDKHAVLRDTTVQVGVIGADGYLESSNFAVSGKHIYLGDREHFLVHVARDTGQVFISKPVIGRASRRPSVQISRRINRPDGSFGGVMVLSLDPEYLSKFYESIDIGHNGVITVVGLDGIVRARATANGRMTVGQNLKSAEILRALPKASDGHFEVVSPIDGIDRLFNYRMLVGYPLVVNVGLARHDVLVSYASRRDVLIASAVTVSLLLIAAAGLLMRQAGRQMKTEAELRRYQDELLENRDVADAANRAKSQFLASMSHELRTPLNAIIGFSEFMAGGGLGPAGSPKYLEYARDIHNSGRHLLDMITDILDMSKIEAGQYEITLEDVDLPSVAAFAMRLVAGRAEAGQITLASHIDPALPKLHADERALRQIFLNLLANAVKFTPAGGSVTMSAAMDQRGSIVITFADTGIGISDVDLAHLGEPFRQVGPVNQPREGTGLGLAITKRLVELHGGTITIWSAVKRGTTVTVTLPMMTPQPEWRVAIG